MRRTVSPVVTFEPLEEISQTFLLHGSYLASVQKSNELPVNAPCPLMAPTQFVIDLKKEFAMWAGSANGSPISKIILQNNGEFEIIVSALIVRISQEF